MNKTLMSYLNEPIEIYKNKIDFLKNNDIQIFSHFDADDYDYQIFVVCSEIYSKTGLNFFKRYSKFLYTIHFGTLHLGIKEYRKGKLDDEHFILQNYISDLLQHVEDMRFFSIPQVNDMNCNDYLALIKVAQQELDEILHEEKLLKIKKQKLESKNRKEKYFNFSKDETVLFKEYSEICIDLLTTKSYLISELYTVGHVLSENEVFLIMLCDQDIPIRIGASKNIITWAKKHSVEIDDPIFYILPIVENMSRELIVKLTLHYTTLPQHPAMIRLSNKIYGNLTHAKKVYNDLYGFNLTTLKKIISISGIWKSDFGGATIIEKEELDTQVKRFLKERER